MASVNKDSKGWRIMFVDPNGDRRQIRPGKGTNKATAQKISRHMEELIACKVSQGILSRQTALWLGKIGDQLHEKLVNVGLTEPRWSVAIGEFIAKYIAMRNDAKPATVRKWQSCERHLVQFFGSKCDLRSLSAGDADEFRSYLYGRNLSENTVRRYCGIAKQFFRSALRKKFIEENPFADQVAAVMANTDRYHFVTSEDAARILEACPDSQWRLIFALCRYGGLRCPSEVLALRWCDIDWANDRFQVHSSKTEHHEGGGSRFVPIFPELRPWLEEAYELAAEGAIYCITRYRDQTQNLRTTFGTIIDRAGVQRWVKPFQNLRSTRETELAEEFPLHVVTAWMGNSQLVAARHYLQVTDDHFAKASSPKVAHIVAQKLGETRRTGENPISPVSRKPSQFTESSQQFVSVRGRKVGDEGLEPPTPSV